MRTSNTRSEVVEIANENSSSIISLRIVVHIVTMPNLFCLCIRERKKTHGHTKKIDPFDGTVSELGWMQKQASPSAACPGKADNARYSDLCIFSVFLYRTGVILLHNPGCFPKQVLSLLRNLLSARTSQSTCFASFALTVKSARCLRLPSCFKIPTSGLNYAETPCTPASPTM